MYLDIVNQRLNTPTEIKATTQVLLEALLESQKGVDLNGLNGFDHLYGGMDIVNESNASHHAILNHIFSVKSKGYSEKNIDVICESEVTTWLLSKSFWVKIWTAAKDWFAKLKAFLVQKINDTMNFLNSSKIVLKSKYGFFDIPQFLPFFNAVKLDNVTQMSNSLGMSDLKDFYRISGEIEQYVNTWSYDNYRLAILGVPRRFTMTGPKLTSIAEAVQEAAKVLDKRFESIEWIIKEQVYAAEEQYKLLTQNGPTTLSENCRPWGAESGIISKEIEAENRSILYEISAPIITKTTDTESSISDLNVFSREQRAYYKSIIDQKRVNMMIKIQIQFTFRLLVEMIDEIGSIGSELLRPQELVDTNKIG